MLRSGSDRRLTALVGDANPYGVRLVRGALALAGIDRIVEARDGAEALEALAERRPDLLVLSWDLPVIGLPEIVGMAREGGGAGGGAPILVTMTEPTRSAVEAALALAVDSIVAAPFSPGEMRRRVEEIVRSRPARPH